MPGKGPNNAGQATKVFGHMVNGEKVKPAKKKGGKKNGK